MWKLIESSSIFLIQYILHCITSRFHTDLCNIYIYLKSDKRTPYDTEKEKES